VFGWHLTFRVDADIKAASLAQIAATPILETKDEQIHEVPSVEHPVQSDPTIVNAGKLVLVLYFFSCQRVSPIVTTQGSFPNLNLSKLTCLSGLTEINEPAAAVLANGNNESVFDTQGIPQNSGFGEGAANAAAEANWDNNNDLSTSQEWVEVPRDANETETGVTGTPAAPSNVQSWADDQPDSPVEVSHRPAIP
jgi:hypothetical protein